MTNSIRIGRHALPGRVVLAPMAGISDQPFRQLCRHFGASLATTEMTCSDIALWESPKSRQRLALETGAGPLAVQIAGSEPGQLAGAARAVVELGADIVDINMGCPAKKVCRKAAGSALLRDESLVGRILDAVVGAVGVPVTLKMRTGWDPDHRNGVRIARLAENAGIQALAVHGRTRACAFRGAAEYATIAQIKNAVDIPVFANGDIDSPQKAVEVLSLTGADGLMIGRAARGRPWIFSQLETYLSQKRAADDPPLREQRDMLLSHLDAMYRFYGEVTGVRVARKHLTWYCKNLAGTRQFRYQVVRAATSRAQMQLTREFFERRVAWGAVAA